MKPPSERWPARGRMKGISAALASAVFLGLAPIFGKQAILAGFTPLAVVALRTGIAVLLLLVIMAIFQRPFFYIYPVGLVGCLLAGLINGLGSILYYSGLSRLDASIGQLIYSFYPLFFAFWLLLDRQPIQRVTLFRLLLAVPGIFLLVSTGSKPVDLPGALMMAGSAIFYALHLLINQRILYEVPAPTVTLYTLISMSVTVFLAYSVFDRTLPFAGTPLGNGASPLGNGASPLGNGAAIYIPVLGLAAITFFSRITLFLGVKHLGGMQTAIIGLAELLVTVFLAVWWLGETLSSLQWLGGICLAISLILVGFDRTTPEKRRSTGWLSWLNPPQIQPPEIHWHS